ncbi:MAG: DUF3488 and transglutaminase-like domain-containing protein [Promicromonosporaceae bacterium]|nr:DUF3488 and transglutaminase-like domain-containing protein [Promicromonosporaceae bacterium]
MIPAQTSVTTRLAVATALVTAAVISSMVALTQIVLPPWPAMGTVGVLLVAVVLVTTRALLGGRRARLAAAARAGATLRRVPSDDGGAGSALPTVLGLVVGLWYLLARFGGPGGTTDWLVGPRSVGHLFDQVGAAGDVIRSEVAPVVSSPAVALLCIGGSIGVLIVADALVAGLRHPLIGGAVVLVLWSPSLVLTSSVPWHTFAVTVAALLLGLTLDGSPTPRRALRDARVATQVRSAERRRAVRTTVTAAGVTAVALAAGGAIASVPGGGGTWTNMFTTSSHSVRLADNLDVYRSLSARSDSVVLSYTTTSSDNVGPLRLMTLSTFDGRAWVPQGSEDGQQVDPGTVLFPQTVQTTDPTTVKLTVGSMREPHLPVSIEPRSVQADGDWRYDSVRDQVFGGPQTEQGQTFTLTVHPRDLSADILRAEPSGANDVAAQYLDVPDSPRKSDIEALAHQLVGKASTDFDKAVLIQDYLRGPSFTYDVNVPRGRTGDAVWDFLQQRRGYCVQFATSMVVLARSLGIPARLGVGYLPGTQDPQTGTWTVTGKDSHAWPELYFPGSGWVRFEPTPAVQTGAAPAYASSTTTSGGTVSSPTPTIADNNPHQTAGPTQGAVPTATETRTPAQVAHAQSELHRWLIGAGVLLLLVAGALVLAVRRRRSRPPRDAEEAWNRVVAALSGAGVSLPTATTPRRAPGEAATAWAAKRGEPIPDDVRTGLATLADALENERYAARAEQVDGEALAQMVREVTAGIAGR